MPMAEAREAPTPPEPDRPVAFGYKQVWLAVRDREPREVAEALGLRKLRVANWKEGIRRSYETDRREGRRKEIFVTPPVAGWTLAVGGIGSLPYPDLPGWQPFLEGLSERFGHIQFFGTHRVSESHFWARADGGQIVRAYYYADGETRIDLGDPTPEEIDLGFRFLDLNPAPQDVIDARWADYEGACEALKRMVESDAPATEIEEAERRNMALRPVPDEDSVMAVAGRWSIDPMRLEEMDLAPGLGLLGEVSPLAPR